LWGRGRSSKYYSFERYQDAERFVDWKLNEEEIRLKERPEVVEQRQRAQERPKRMKQSQKRDNSDFEL
jgi:hypothetical protein